MKQFKGLAPIVSLVLFFCLAGPLSGEADPLRIFRIGTGGKTGVYYPLGKLIAEGLTRQCSGKNLSSGNVDGTPPGFIAVAQNSAGSVENVDTILCHETEAGMVQADVAGQAYESSGLFAGNPESGKIRAIASLYPEKFQIVVRRDARISKIEDLKGKRISLDEQGSGTLAVMRIILGACHLAEQDLMPVYLKPVFTKRKMISGELQGFVMMAGLPMDAVLDLTQVGISLVPIPGDIAGKINILHPHLVPGSIPANTYPGVPETPTVQVYALLAVHADTPSDLVYEITKALWSKSMGTLFRKGHAQARDVTLDTALTGLTIPLHKGAERFYKKMGMPKKESPSP
ncbi:TAXI family TRAP transporter solute-binding subunit [Desulfospira joergensenii]|uniref:TAXI family TRAP transporter solute-binding subunit n=1 Tax=Desulfospira joergensenii TaxID=53329 RepID=UPI0003B7A79D|nr:TAXI family TRAP transporter solute-binding subunit [Desulfospira joergensenii]